jgi:hypothetical protein
MHVFYVFFATLMLLQVLLEIYHTVFFLNICSFLYVSDIYYDRDHMWGVHCTAAVGSNIFEESSGNAEIWWTAWWSHRSQYHFLLNSPPPPPPFHTDDRLCGLVCTLKKSDRIAKQSYTVFLAYQANTLCSNWADTQREGVTL